MHPRKKILWLVSWYPNKYNPFDGDFIQRHAKAAALHHDIHVLFVRQANKQLNEEEVVDKNDGLTEQIIYLPKKSGWRGKLQNFRSWQHSYKKAIRVIIETESPSLIHVHVPWKVGLMALWAKKEFKVDYLVTEHWGIYNTIAGDNINTKPFLFRLLLKRIYQQAVAFVSVSRFLGEGVNKTVLKKEFRIIPNVVDTALFYSTSDKHESFTFVHVSNMVALKNVEGILLAFKAFLHQANADVRLLFIGNTNDDYERFARSLNLSGDVVIFKGEILHEQVAKEMRRCHALVLNSNIENSPCVIGEALCCGLPVVATAVGGIPELLSEENGLLILPENVSSLTHALTEMFLDFSRFKTLEIASVAAGKFGMEAIAGAFSDLYNAY